MFILHEEEFRQILNESNLLIKGFEELNEATDLILKEYNITQGETLMTYLINLSNGRVQTIESWCLDVFNNFITQDVFNNLVECDELGEVL